MKKILYLLCASIVGISFARAGEYTSAMIFNGKSNLDYSNSSFLGGLSVSSCNGVNLSNCTIGSGTSDIDSAANLKLSKSTNVDLSNTTLKGATLSVEGNYDFSGVKIENNFNMPEDRSSPTRGGSCRGFNTVFGVNGSSIKNLSIDTTIREDYTTENTTISYPFIHVRADADGVPGLVRYSVAAIAGGASNWYGILDGMYDVDASGVKVRNSVYANNVVVYGAAALSYITGTGMGNVSFANSDMEISAVGTDSYAFGICIGHANDNGSTHQRNKMTNISLETAKITVKGNRLAMGLYTRRTLAENNIFRNAEITASTVVSGEMSRAIELVYTKMTNSDFSGAKLAADIAFHAQSCEFNAVSFKKTVFNGYTYGFSASNSTFENVSFASAEFKSQNSESSFFFYNCIFKDVDFSGARMVFGDYEEGHGQFMGCFLDGVSFSGMRIADVSFFDCVINRVSFRGADIKLDQVYEMKSYKSKDLQNVDFSDTSLAEIDLSGQNLTNSKFRNADLSKANFEGANLTNADLRGADLTDVSGKYTLKNTIMTDGVIKEFLMATADDSIAIAKHTNKTASLSRMARGFSTYNGISAKISEADSAISGGAKMTIDDGGLLEVVDGKSLTVADGGILEFNIGEDYIGAMLSLESGSSFIFDGGEIVINLSSALAENGMYTFELIDTLNGSFAGYDSLANGGNIKLLVDGEVYGGDWSFAADASGLFVSVPEPSTYAAILGIFALGFVIYRRKK